VGKIDTSLAFREEVTLSWWDLHREKVSQERTLVQIPGCRARQNQGQLVPVSNLLHWARLGPDRRKRVGGCWEVLMVSYWGEEGIHECGSHG
jgi:hypothetical protein